jgi:hypothetical protein
MNDRASLRPQNGGIDLSKTNAGTGGVLKTVRYASPQIGIRRTAEEKLFFGRISDTPAAMTVFEIEQLLALLYGNKLVGGFAGELCLSLAALGIEAELDRRIGSIL